MSTPRAPGPPRSCAPPPPPTTCVPVPGPRVQSPLTAFCPLCSVSPALTGTRTTHVLGSPPLWTRLPGTSRRPGAPRDSAPPRHTHKCLPHVCAGPRPLPVWGGAEAGAPTAASVRPLHTATLVRPADGAETQTSELTTSWGWWMCWRHSSHADSKVSPETTLVLEMGGACPETSRIRQRKRIVC